ncbi:hypothetical protein ACT1U9_05120 [Streptomyces sp. BR1]|uniref:hypothetical protein n=1 Tax=Streptomyces sp. BR1 TaxID=1592323 RepID=UPI00402B899D
MSADTDTDRAISDWLASAHPTPSTAWAEWQEGGIAMLPTGRAFDAVRVSAEIIHAAAGSRDPRFVGAYLSNVMDGPVIHDAYDVRVRYYAMVPLGSCARHLTPDALLLTPRSTWLGVPAVHRTARPGAYWINPPVYQEYLCAPDGVDEVIALGRRNLATLGELGARQPVAW